MTEYQDFRILYYKTTYHTIWYDMIYDISNELNQNQNNVTSCDMLHYFRLNVNGNITSLPRGFFKT